MAERLHRSSDVPDFDTYPADPAETNTALEQRARQVGSTVGKAVVVLRKAQERLKDTAEGMNAATACGVNQVKNTAQQAAGKISEITETAKNKAQEWSQAAASRADELRQTAADKVSELGSQIKTGYYRTRIRTNQMVREYPLHVVLSVGILGFLIGMGLRIWRANRE